MKENSHPCVVSPPPKPLMIWDGECHFCRLWIERWREITRGKVEYAMYQEVAENFPEISRTQFQKSVVYIDKSGEVFFAAEAVYRSLRCRSSRKWLAWSYDHVPGFAPVSETVYKFIACHRNFGSAITRLLWGDDVRPPTYFVARRWFLRALGLVYLIAFVSLWVQVEGLIGSNGVTPVSAFLAAVRGELGPRALSILPTLCWFNSSDAFLHFLCGSGVVLSLLLIFEIAPVVSLIALFVFYLSLTIAGQTFLSFQWGILLLEAGFLSRLFFAQAPSFQIDGDVRRGEVDQRRRLLVEFDRARLSLLVAAVADNLRLVGRSTSGVVQTFLGRFLPYRRNHRAGLFLDTAAITADRMRLGGLPANRDRGDRQLLFFQFAHD